MKRLVFALLFFSLCRIAASQEPYPADASFSELPRYEDSDIVIAYEGFTVCYDTLKKNPVWVAYRLSSARTQGEIGRESRFTCDDRFPWPQARTGDYSYSGFDRGHMAPAADMKWSKKAMKDCFHMTNICPQTPELNRKVWKVLEDRCRDWARKFGYVYIVCGPLFESSEPCTIGVNEVAVPDAFFKAIVAPSEDSFQSIGFIFANDRENQRLNLGKITVDSVEVRSGLDLFYRMEESIEQHTDWEIWGLEP